MKQIIRVTLALALLLVPAGLYAAHRSAVTGPPGSDDPCPEFCNR